MINADFEILMKDIKLRNGTGKIRMSLVECFNEYASIPNESVKVVEKYKKIKGSNWIVTEKVHGSNLSFITDGVELVTAKRSCVLKPDDKFFDYQDIVAIYGDRLKDSFNNIKKDYPETKVIQIYGEIFGGNYPGFYSKKKPVQKDIYYSQDIQYIVFDIKITSNTDEKCYIQQSKLSDYLADGIHVVPTLFIGELEEALKISPVFQTKVPDNFAEGIVIRLDDVSESRFPLKIKNPKFDEIVRKKKPQPKFSISKLRDKVKRYCTQNRFNNVMSKLGRDVAINDVKESMIGDIFKELEGNINKEEKVIYDANKEKLVKFVTIYLSKSGLIDKWYTEFN